MLSFPDTYLLCNVYVFYPLPVGYLIVTKVRCTRDKLCLPPFSGRAKVGHFFDNPMYVSWFGEYPPFNVCHYDWAVTDVPRKGLHSTLNIDGNIHYLPFNAELSDSVNQAPDTPVAGAQRMHTFSPPDSTVRLLHNPQALISTCGPRFPTVRSAFFRFARCGWYAWDLAFWDARQNIIVRNSCNRTKAIASACFASGCNRYTFGNNFLHACLHLWHIAQLLDSLFRCTHYGCYIRVEAFAESETETCRITLR